MKKAQPKLGLDDSGICQEIFDAIVVRAMGRRMAEGRVLYSDSTHLQANANKQRLDRVQVRQASSACLPKMKYLLKVLRMWWGRWTSGRLKGDGRVDVPCPKAAWPTRRCWV